MLLTFNTSATIPATATVCPVCGSMHLINNRCCACGSSAVNVQYNPTTLHAMPNSITLNLQLQFK